ncbi:MAG: HipA N-terminal domain-containing protein [Elusimicrobia bacterium]|nr:HipA N-terminal domain-containing protein [Elusimicrobiota bacterium]
MERKEERALVFYGDKEAGELIKKPAGYEFAYKPEYLRDPDAMPISLAMPLAETPYESPSLFPFFDGLLPEGWLLELTCSSAKIDKNDKFHLLLHTGKDPIGAISIRPADKESHGE